MGEAKRRGTFEQRQAQAIWAGRGKVQAARRKLGQDFGGARIKRRMLPPALLTLFSLYRGNR